MKYVILILFLASLGSIIAGFLLDTELSQKLIGFGVVGLFVFVFPLFAYYRWKDRSLKDYMLTRENLDKMREYRNERKY